MIHPDFALDVRYLPCPEPLEECLTHARALEPQQRLEVRIGREPLPLFDILEREGYAWQCTPEDDHFLVSIWIRSDHATRA